MARTATKKSDVPAAGRGLLGPRGAAVPLQGVRITGRLEGTAAALTVLQRYRNTESKPLEAVYVFPLPSEAAVTGLEVRVGDRVLTAAIEDREKAFERYDDALREGHGATLLDQERPNVFQVSVGSILPGQTVLVEIRLALLADSWERGVRLMIPATVSPRYTPASLPPEVLREIERTTPSYALAVPYGVSVEIDAVMPSAIRAVESPSHPVRAEVDGSRARVVLARDVEAPDRDFVLTVEAAEPHRPGALLVRRNGRDHLLVELRPDLPQPARPARDLLFLVDCSGSMNGDSIDEARRAVELCLRALGPGDRFQVVRFGSTHQALFPDFQEYTQESLDRAVALVRAMRADLGGTEILGALTAAAARPAKGWHLDAIVLTDGEVSNEELVLAFARQHRGAVRFFSFGIGAGSSEFLVRGLARESGGEAEFIHPGERIEEKVLRQFSRIASPALTDLSLDWGGLKVEQAPASLPPVFAGGTFRVLARLGKSAASCAGRTVRLSGTAGSGPVEWTATVAEAGDGGAIPGLWARERIRDLEAGFGVAAGSRQKRGSAAGKRAIVALSKEYGVLCSETSFVAVEERPEAERTDGEVELRRVPVMVTAGWHGGVQAMVNYSPTSSADNQVRACHFMPSRGSERHGSIGRPAKRIRAIAKSPSESRPPASAQRGGSFSVFEEDPPGLDLDIPTFLRQPIEKKQAPPPWHLALLMEQRADGSFRLTELLVRESGLTADDVNRLLHESHLDEETLATALAFLTLHRRAGGDQALWEPAAQKAKNWLDAHGGQVRLEPLNWLNRELDHRSRK